MHFLAFHQEHARAAEARSGARPAPRTRAMRASTGANPFHLTARELQVLLLLCEGLRNAAIAARLVRSVRTVDHHLAAVFGKLGVASRTAAVAIALTSGLRPRTPFDGERNLGKPAVVRGDDPVDTACAATSCR